MSDRIAKFLEESGLDIPPTQIRDLGDGIYVFAQRLMFHWTVKIGYFDFGTGEADRWCLQNDELAMAALEAWPMASEADPLKFDPPGWHRHPYSDTYRYLGQKDLEYIAKKNPTGDLEFRDIVSARVAASGFTSTDRAAIEKEYLRQVDPDRYRKLFGEDPENSLSNDI